MYSDGYRTVQQVGERTAGSAYAQFRVIDSAGTEIGKVAFQHDTIPAVGVVGWTNECLLAVIMDRLQSFQTTFPCAENDIAYKACAAALRALEYRTELRKARGVEGSHTK